MGAAKIRKKNGAYSTREQIAAMELQRLREDIERSFILSPADLKLPDVPKHARESVRAFLAPFLPGLPVKDGECWLLAQMLMTLANSPRVAYVEGVWTSKSHQDQHRLGQCDCDDYGKKMFGAPHAWNTVDGHLVDLSVENKFRVSEPEYPLDNWLHEPHRVFTHEEFKQQEHLLDGADLCSLFVEVYNSQADVFRSASDRLQARYEQMVQEAAA